MAINDKLIVQEAAAAGGDSNPNILLDLNASDVDSYDGDGDVWYDIHDFEYKPTTNVAQHFNTVLYDGDDNTVAQPITGAGFTPDLVWIKTRNQATRHILTDSIRGVSSQLFSSETSAPIDYAEFTSFDLDGFTVKRNTGTDYLNQSGIEYVAWCFKAGGASVTNTNGDLQSQVSANNDLGFSIVTYTGNNSFGQTVGHGLDVQPQMVIYKNLSNARNWRTYVEAIGATNYLNLDDTSAVGTYGSFNNTSPTSTVFSTTNSVADRATNFNGDNFIAYCFTSKRGVSKVGSYEGTGAAGNKVYTGFEPAFLMIKNADNSSAVWIMVDNKRDPNNPVKKKLAANSNAAENDASTIGSDTQNQINFNRDGFTLLDANNFINTNKNGDTFIYYAVAKNTNETSLIAPGTNLKLGLDAGTYSGSGNWLDSSGNSNNGVITGATWKQELGNFFEFNAAQNDKISVASSTAIQSATSYSIESWINPTTFSGIPHLWSIFGSGNKSFCYINDTNGNVNFTVYNDSSSNSLITNSTVKLKLNKWNHVMCTVGNGGFLKVYINGEEAGSISQTGTQLTTGTSPFLIGALSGYTAYDFTGGIGQVRLYSAVLSLAQVRQNYNFTKPRYPNEFHGDITGASFVPAAGADVDHFDFNGTSSNYINIPTPRFLTGDFTVSIWANFDVLSGFKMLFGGSHYSSSAGSLGHYINGNGLSTWITNASGTPSNIITTSGNFVINTWYNIMLVREGSTITAYVGNSSVGTGTYSGDLSSPITRLGNHYNDTSYPFDGSVSKVKIYNKALTDAERTVIITEGQ